MNPTFFVALRQSDWDRIVAVLDRRCDPAMTTILAQLGRQEARKGEILETWAKRTGSAQKLLTDPEPQT